MVSRGIALLFSRTFGTRWGGGQPHAPVASTSGKDLVPIVQDAGWAPGPVRMGGKSRPYRDSIPDRPARSQQLYRLNYPAHAQHGAVLNIVGNCNTMVSIVILYYIIL